MPTSIAEQPAAARAEQPQLYWVAQSPIKYIEKIEGGQRMYNRPRGLNDLACDICNEIDRKLRWHEHESTDAGLRWTIWYAGAWWWVYI